jgi:hypothetical protein
MIKTYEVHDSDSEDDDEMVEFDPQVVENLNWWQKCFVPKYPDNPHGEDRVSESSIPTPTQQKGVVVEEIAEEARCRIYSEDVTVSTNLTTPPGTPNVPKHPSSSSHNSNSDVETPSVRNVISAIDEESEEVDKSDESKEYDELVCTLEEYKEDIVRRELTIEMSTT